MLSPQKAGLLQDFLGKLPEHLAARLTKAVEFDRLADGKGLPHDVILEGLRPVLRRVDTRDRTPTPLRLFCQPFEDLLTSAPRSGKQKGRIARASVSPVWRWIGTLLTPKAVQSYIEEVKALLVAGKSDIVRARGGHFQAEISRHVRDALSTERGRQDACNILGDDDAVNDAHEMALLLAAGNEILALQNLLPKPVASFTEDLVAAARDIYEQVIAKSPDAAPYVAVVAMNRLARRWEALRLPALVARRQNDTLIASTDMGLAGEILFADIDVLSKAIRAVRHPRFDADSLVDNIASFAELSSAVVKEIGVRRDGKWGQGLLKDRAGVGEVMNEFMERAPKEIGNAFPSQKISRPVDPEKIERALRYATLVAGCKPFAAAASFAASLEKAHRQCIEFLRIRNDEVVRELRNAEPARRQLVQDQLALATELTAILFGEEEADLLRRRGRAALAAAA